MKGNVRLRSAVGWAEEEGGERGFGAMLAFSLLAHVLLAALFLWAPNIGRISRLPPPPSYSVRLVSSRDLAPRKSKAPPAPKARVKKPPPPPKKLKKVKKTPPKPARPRKKEMVVKKNDAPPKVAERKENPEERLRGFLNSLKKEAKEEQVEEITSRIARSFDEAREEEASGVVDRIRRLEYDRFTADIQGKVRTLWRRPPGIDEKADPLCEVRMIIARDGKVLDYSVESSSGNRLFDQSVLRALAKVRTVGRPPHGYPDEFVLRFRDAELSKAE